MNYLDKLLAIEARIKFGDQTKIPLNVAGYGEEELQAVRSIVKDLTAYKRNHPEVITTQTIVLEKPQDATKTVDTTLVTPTPPTPKTNSFLDWLRNLFG